MHALAKNPDPIESRPRGRPASIVGRYALYGEIASGGMATVHVGRLLGPVRFSKTVAIKRLHPQFAKDPEFVGMFLDEARLAGRLSHPNIVSTLDVVALDGELFLVMEYVLGETLSRLLRAAREMNQRVPVDIAASIVAGTLHGLHAAHETKDERGEPLGIVHRDVSPQNVMVGVDGVARVLDFGIAKAAARIQDTRSGQFKGKLAYSAPEQLAAKKLVDRRVDIYATGILLWELLAGRRCFSGDTDLEVFGAVMRGGVAPPSTYAPEAPPELDAITACALQVDPTMRFATARDMAIALEEAVPLASQRAVGEWVERMAKAALATRAERVSEIESVSQPLEVSSVEGASSSSAKFTMPRRADEAAVEAAGAHVASAIRRMFAAGLVGALVVAALLYIAVRPAPGQPRAQPEASGTERPIQAAPPSASPSAAPEVVAVRPAPSPASTASSASEDAAATATAAPKGADTAPPASAAHPTGKWPPGKRGPLGHADDHAHAAPSKPPAATPAAPPAGFAPPVLER